MKESSIENNFLKKSTPDNILEDVAMYALPGEQPPTDKDVEIYKETKQRIFNDISSDNISRLIEQYILKKNINAALEIATLIPDPPINSKENFYTQLVYLIKHGLESYDVDAWLLAAKLIQRLPDGAQREFKADLSRFIRAMLNSRDSYCQAIATDLIQYVDKVTQKSLLELLNLIIDNAWKTEHKVIRQNILYIAEKAIKNKNISYDKTISLISEGLKDTHEGILVNALYLIQFAPEEKRTELIRLAWKNENIKDADKAGVIDNAPKDIREQLWNEWYSGRVGSIKETELQNLAKSTPLYKDIPDKFFRRDFPKSGSRTTLLGTIPAKPQINLKEKIIVRHVTASAYINWTKAFENYEFWKTHGFSYVPVEPIVRTRLETRTGRIAVFSRVLGPSVGYWQAKTPLFKEEIKKQLDNIIAGLKELGIEHGHTHMGNFCLLFNKMPTGEADIKIPPRVYVIDFDEATSSQI